MTPLALILKKSLSGGVRCRVLAQPKERVGPAEGLVRVVELAPQRRDRCDDVARRITAFQIQVVGLVVNRSGQVDESVTGAGAVGRCIQVVAVLPNLVEVDARIPWRQCLPAEAGAGVPAFHAGVVCGPWRHTGVGQTPGPVSANGAVILADPGLTYGLRVAGPKPKLCVIQFEYTL